MYSEDQKGRERGREKKQPIFLEFSGPLPEPKCLVDFKMLQLFWWPELLLR